MNEGCLEDEKGRWGGRVVRRVDQIRSLWFVGRRYGRIGKKGTWCICRTSC